LKNSLNNFYYSSIVSNIDVKKKLVFIVEKKEIAKFVNIKYFYRKCSVKFFKKVSSDFLYVFKKLETMTFSLPVFKTIVIRVRNKKKTKKKQFLVLSSKCFNNFDSFINFILINNSYFILKLFKEFDIKTKYLEEFLKKKYKKTCVLQNGNINFYKEFFYQYLIKDRIKKPKNFIEKKYVTFNSFVLNLSIYSNYFVYFYNLVSIIIMNEQKFVLFLYKYYRNKKIKI